MTETQGSHWHDCYKSHHECAIAEVERLRKALELIAAPFNAICATENELLIVATARQDIAMEALDDKCTKRI